MTRYVALLRGVNVGGHKKLSMPDLRKMMESAGYNDVATLINSGNVVFSSSKTVKPAIIESAIEKTFKLDVDVMLRTGADLKRVVKNVPFEDTEHVHVGFLHTKPAATVNKLDHDQWAPEDFAYKGTELYLYLPNGTGRTKLPPWLDRQVEVPVTIRNWNTVLKLRDLAS